MSQTTRRHVLLASSALLVASVARAQAPQGRPYRIGFATVLSSPVRKAFLELMEGAGWVHGKHFVFSDSGMPMGADVEEAARRIVAQKPDLIVVISTAYAVAVQSIDSMTPTVMMTSGYPVAAGVVQSLARPGKNVTGNTIYAGAGIWGKLFQLLRESKPGVQRIGLLWDYLPPLFPPEEIQFGMVELRADARSLGMEVHIFEVRSSNDLNSALAALNAWKADAVLVSSGPVIFPHRASVMKAMLDHRLPTITDGHWVPSVEPSPLLAYAPPAADIWRQTVGYIDRIMRGARASDLPIQHPARFELVVNQKTAAAIGLKLSQSLLLRADRVID